MKSTPIVHTEINVKNLTRAKKFYSKLFGWKFEEMAPGYEVFSLGKEASGALCKGVTGGNSITPYFEVVAIDKTLAKAKVLKAKVVLEKMSIGEDRGLIAHIKDSEGNIIGIWSMK